MSNLNLISSRHNLTANFTRKKGNRDKKKRKVKPNWKNIAAAGGLAAGAAGLVLGAKPTMQYLNSYQGSVLKNQVRRAMSDATYKVQQAARDVGRSVRRATTNAILDGRGILQRLGKKPKISPVGVSSSGRKIPFTSR